MVVDNTARDISRIAAARFNLPIPNSTFKELKSRLITTDWIANPVVQISGEQVCLQGKDIQEGQAHFVERTLVEKLTSAGDLAWDRTGLPFQYTRAYDYFIERCGISRSAEFPVICDLAQQTSWDPVLPTSEVEWRKSSPSWRFVQITELLANDDKLSFGGHLDWPDRFTDIAEDIFGRLGYLPLEKVIEERLIAFTRVPELLDVEQVMKEAMEFRLKKPWMLPNPAADLLWLEELMNKFRAPSVIVDGAFGSFGDSSVKGDQIIFELHYQALANQLIGPINTDENGKGRLQCGFGQFKIERGCPYQSSHNCSTQFSPNAGPPVPTMILDNGVVDGCSFAFALQNITGDLNAIKLVPAARFPSI
ncbi:hypothetical protein GCM10027276_11420 [Comamonas piscis]